MADAKYYPDNWIEYCADCKRKSQDIDAKWAVFAARFRVAGNFGGGVWFGMNERTTRGYDAAIRLLLAYSALEAACSASRLKVHHVRLEGEYLSECRRKVRLNFSPLADEEFALRRALQSAYLKNRLDDFFEKKSDDLMPFATAVRHLFAHGIWTPKGSNALTKQAVDAIDWISHGLRLTSQSLFEKFYENLR
jgi:hypothetical protein